MKIGHKNPRAEQLEGFPSSVGIPSLLLSQSPSLLPLSRSTRPTRSRLSRLRRRSLVLAQSTGSGSFRVTVLLSFPSTCQCQFLSSVLQNKYKQTQQLLSSVLPLSRSSRPARSRSGRGRAPLRSATRLPCCPAPPPSSPLAVRSLCLSHSLSLSLTLSLSLFLLSLSLSLCPLQL